MPILLVPYLLGKGEKNLGFTVVCQGGSKFSPQNKNVQNQILCFRYTNVDTIPYFVQVREAQWLISQNRKNILPRGLSNDSNVRMQLPLAYTVHGLYVCDALKRTGRWSARLNAWKPAQTSCCCVKLFMLLVFFALCLVGSSACKRKDKLHSSCRELSRELRCITSKSRVSISTSTHLPAEEG